MSNPLKVLILEDVESDVELALRELRAGGITVTHRWVDSLPAFSSAIDEFRPEIILADYSLPGVDCYAALAAARERAPDVPLIFVSGTMGEEVAIESLKSGATDYVLKERISRLGSAVTRALREAAERRARREVTDTLQTLIDGAPLAILTLDAVGRTQSWNASAEHMLGWGEGQVMGSPPPFIPRGNEDEFETLWARALVGDSITNVERSGLRSDGTPIDLSISVAPLRAPDGVVRGIIVLIADVAEQRRTAERLRQTQKLEAIGRLAGGIAHDFNNLLTVIGGSTQFALDALDPGHRARDDLETVLATTRRASALTNQLLAFSRRQVLEPRILNLNDLVEGMAKMLRRIIGEDIHLELGLHPDLGSIRADAGQIEQVLLNLAANARDAMLTGGTLWMETGHVVLDEHFVPSHPGFVPGDYVRLAVRDSGVGMAPEAMEHLFEPFFTTKRLGEGTGLGLATVHGIVGQSGGQITVESVSGEGTCFSIYLPRVKEEARRSAVAAKDPTPRGTGLVLLVEDQVDVRRLVQRMLGALGYEVVAARSGSEAIAMVQASERPIGLLLVDVVMPGVSGPDLVQQLRAGGQHAPVLFMSGYTDEMTSKYLLAGPDTHVLRKPFTIEALAQQLHHVLTEHGA